MLLILAGKSASGKDTLLNELIKNQNFNPLVSTTTRPMREGENEGKEYFFVSKEQFFNMQRQNKFLEYRSYKTLVNNKSDIWYYGMTKQNLDPDKNYAVILDLTGAKACKDYYKDFENVKCVYIDASDNIREKRAIHRKSFDRTEWDRRLITDRSDFSNEKIQEVCDFCIKNEDVSLSESVQNILNEISLEYDLSDEIEK